MLSVLLSGVEPVTAGAGVVGVVLAGVAGVDDGAEAGVAEAGVLEEEPPPPLPEDDEAVSALACECDPEDVALGVGTAAGGVTGAVEVLGLEGPSPPEAPVPAPVLLFLASASTLACVSLWL